MTRFNAALLAILAVAAMAAPARPAAAIEYPWCAQYSGGDTGGALNCGFVTLEQCRATISGIGGTCEPNQLYTGPIERPAKKVYKRRGNN
jgi:hypothetical protein